MKATKKEGRVSKSNYKKLLESIPVPQPMSASNELTNELQKEFPWASSDTLRWLTNDMAMLRRRILDILEEEQQQRPLKLEARWGFGDNIEEDLREEIVQLVEHYRPQLNEDDRTTWEELSRSVKGKPRKKRKSCGH